MRHALIFAAAALVASGHALAQGAKPVGAADPLAKLYTCAGLTDDSARLACYDEEVKRIEAAQKLGAFAAVDAASVQQIRRESFGFSIPSLPRLALPRLGGAPAEDLRELKLTVSDISGPEGRALITMTDGQVWRQNDTDRLRFRKGDEVLIERGPVGNYLMSRARGGGIAIRVVRVQ